MVFVAIGFVLGLATYPLLVLLAVSAVEWYRSRRAPRLDTLSRQRIEKMMRKDV